MEKQDTDTRPPKEDSETKRGKRTTPNIWGDEESWAKIFTT